MIKLLDILKENQELNYEKGKEAVIKTLQSDARHEYVKSRRGRMIAGILKAVESKPAEEVYDYVADFRSPNKYYLATLYKAFIQAAKEL